MLHALSERLQQGSEFSTSKRMQTLENPSVAFLMAKRGQEGGRRNEEAEAKQKELSEEVSIAMVGPWCGCFKR
jgi:hypothetical protein